MAVARAADHRLVRLRAEWRARQVASCHLPERCPRWGTAPRRSAGAHRSRPAQPSPPSTSSSMTLTKHSGPRTRAGTCRGRVFNPVPSGGVRGLQCPSFYTEQPLGVSRTWRADAEFRQVLRTVGCEQPLARDVSRPILGTPPLSGRGSHGPTSLHQPTALTLHWGFGDRLDTPSVCPECFALSA